MKSLKQFKSELQENKQRNIKVTKNGKTRMLRKQELSTYLQMGWKQVNEDDSDPCWKGYQMVGMKKKNGKEVPNCVPKESVEEKFKVSYKDTGSYSVVFRNKNGKVESEVRADSKEKAEKQAKIRNKRVKPSEGAWEVVRTNESVEETRKYKAPTAAEIEADKKKDRKSRPSMSAKSVSRNVYKNLHGGLKEDFAIYKNGKPLKIKGKEVTSRSKESAQKAIDTMQKQPFNKDAKFTIVQTKTNAPKDTGAYKRYTMQKKSIPAWRYAERGE